MARNSIEAHEETARWEVQLRKGVLEFAILLTLRGGEHYGFELVTSLTSKARINVLVTISSKVGCWRLLRR